MSRNTSRRIKRKECKNKRRHGTHEKAADHMHWLKRQQPKMLRSVIQYRVYKCRFCKAWHVGRRRG